MLFLYWAVADVALSALGSEEGFFVEAFFAGFKPSG